MSIFFWLILLIAAAGVRICRDGFHDDCLSYKRIQPIKGIFILLVFISHFVQYVSLKGVWDAPYFEVRKYLGQLVVVPFLFYSGYGIAESIRKKGYAYVKAMPTHRIAQVLFLFGLAVICFLFLRYVQGIRYQPLYILLSFTGWNSVGNSNWYIFSILVMYASTWLSFMVFRDKKLLSLIGTSFLAGLYILFIKLVSGKDECWCNTILAYVMGLWFSFYREFIFRRIFSGNQVYFGTLAIVLSAFVFLRPYWGQLVIYEFVSCLFALIIVMITAKCQIKSRFLSYCGEHLFSLFILQRIPMIALDNSALEQFPYLYLMVCLALTFLFSWAFDKITQELWTFLLPAIKNQENPK